MADFVQLTGHAGQNVLINRNQVSHVRQHANNQPATVVMSNGLDFEVQEAFEDVLAALGVT